VPKLDDRDSRNSIATITGRKRLISDKALEVKNKLPQVKWIGDYVSAR